MLPIDSLKQGQAVKAAMSRMARIVPTIGVIQAFEHETCGAAGIKLLAAQEGGE